MGKHTVREYANLVGITKQSVYGRVKRNTIKYIVEDGVTYITEEVQPSLLDIDNMVNDTSSDVVILLKDELATSKQLIKQQRKELKQQRKEIKRLNSELVSSKDTVADTLKSYIGEMSKLLPSPTVNVEEIKPKKVKKSKKK